MAVLFCLVYLIYDHGYFLPGWVNWNSFQENIPGTEMTMTLDKKQLSVMNDHVIYESDPKWKVQDAIVKDIDEDGNMELVMLVYRRGNYGEHLPFWVKRNDRSWSQHFFVYRWSGERFKSVWMSSAIGMKAQSFQFDDRILSIQEPDGTQTQWKWENWGFTLQE